MDCKLSNPTNVNLRKLQSESFTSEKKSTGERQTTLAGLGVLPNHTTAVQVDNLKNNVIGGMQHIAAAIPSIRASGDIKHLSTTSMATVMSDHAKDCRSRIKWLDEDKRKVMLSDLGIKAWQTRSDGEQRARIQDERNKLIDRFSDDFPEECSWDAQTPEYQASYLEESKNACQLEALHTLGQEQWASLSKRAQEELWDK